MKVRFIFTIDERDIRVVLFEDLIGFVEIIAGYEIRSRHHDSVALKLLQVADVVDQVSEVNFELFADTCA